MNKAPILIIALAAIALPCTAFAADEVDGGKTIGIPEDKPVLTVMLPEGWQTKKPMAGLAPQLTSGEDGVTIQFYKEDLYNNLYKGDEVPKESLKDQLRMMSDGKNTGPEEWDKQIAGNKVYHATSTSALGAWDMYAFTLDGKTWYRISAYGSEAKVTEAADTIVKVITSIKPK